MVKTVKGPRQHFKQGTLSVVIKLQSRGPVDVNYGGKLRQRRLSRSMKCEQEKGDVARC